MIGEEFSEESIIYSFGVEEESELIIDICNSNEYDMFSCTIYDFDNLIFYFKINDDNILLDVMQSTK